MIALVASVAALRSPLVTSRTSDTPLGTSRRAVLGSGLAIVAPALSGSAIALPANAAPSDVLQSTSGRAAEYASGFTFKPISQIKDEVKSMLGSWDAAYASKDWAKLAGIYTAEADLLDGFAGKPAAVHGSAAAADRFAKSGLTNIASKIVSVAAEGEKIAHVGYQLEYDGGYSRAQITVYDTSDGWKIDEQVLPLESPRTYAALVPKRDNFGHVWMVRRAVPNPRALPRKSPPPTPRSHRCSTPSTRDS